MSEMVLPERSLTMFGTNPVDVLVSKASSHGRMSVTIETCSPSDDLPVHVHSRYDCFLVAFEGELDVFIGDAWQAMRSTGVLIPRYPPHTFRDPTTTDSRLMVVSTPGGMDEFFDRLADMTMLEDWPLFEQAAASWGISFPK